MQQINLKSSEIVLSKKENSGLSILFFGVALLFLSVAVYGVVYYYKIKNSNELSALNEEMKIKESALSGNDYTSVYDFQSRIFDLGEKTKNYQGVTQFLDEVAKAVLPEVRFDSIKNKKDETKTSFELNLITPNHDVLSQQLKAFSQVSGVSNVQLVRSSQTEAGLSVNIKFDMASNLARSVINSEESASKNN